MIRRMAIALGAHHRNEFGARCFVQTRDLVEAYMLSPIGNRDASVLPLAHGDATVGQSPMAALSLHL
jgi:hypothetical protein